MNKSLYINKDKDKYLDISNEDKNREDDDDNEPEWANDNVEDYFKSKIEFKAIPKSLEEKVSKDIEFSKDKIPNICLCKMPKNSVDVDDFFNNYDNNLNVISPIKDNKNKVIYDELKDFMSKDSKNNNANFGNVIQNKLFDKKNEKSNPHFNLFENHNELKDYFNNKRLINSSDENNPKQNNTYNYNLNRINDIRLHKINQNESKIKSLQLQNIYQKYQMAHMHNYINYLKALNNIIQQPTNIQYNNNLFPQNQIPINNNLTFSDIKYLNNYNFQNLENYPNSNLNNRQFINQNNRNNISNYNLNNNFNEFNNNNISKYNLIKHSMNNMNDINNINKVEYVNNLNNILSNAQKCQNYLNSLNFGISQKLSGNFNNIKYNHLNNNLNQVLQNNENVYKNFDNVKYYNNNINNMDNHLINKSNNLIDKREMTNEKIKLENDLKVGAQNKNEKDNYDLKPADYLENPMLILMKNIKKQNWLLFNNEGNVLNNFNSEELYNFLDNKNKRNVSFEEFTINDYDTDIMFPAEFIYKYLKKYYSK